ncbi:MAG: M28 family peptidase [Bacteroidales bacterium]|nr:M28 family peptidase [Bacteroidales bacterium]
MKYRCLFQIILVLAAGAVLIPSCKSGREGERGKPSVKEEPAAIEVPHFDADSAFEYVSRQVAFGPRVPNTPEHHACAEYLFGKLSEWCDTVIRQPFRARAFDGTVLNGVNIIGIFLPEHRTRVMLSAHWDSRPFADYDPDPEMHRTPIDGANDGASGVGVLLEVARQLSLQRPAIGVDLILFDAEDYGQPQDDQGRDHTDTWALGSQHWSRNPHHPGYRARFGILLDMVGAADARFYMEGFSMMYASGVVNKVWTLAARLGFSEYFLFEEGGYVTDDHYYVNTIREIPTIDIIHQDKNSANGSFFEHWHTIRDRLDVISPRTLQVVGQTVLAVIYQEH